jgi:hypothetical protein
MGGRLGHTAITHVVHGLVVFLAVVGATFVADYPGWRILVLSVGSVALFWIARVLGRPRGGALLREGGARNGVPASAAAGLVGVVPNRPALRTLVVINHASDHKIAGDSTAVTNGRRRASWIP